MTGERAQRRVRILQSKTGVNGDPRPAKAQGCRRTERGGRSTERNHNDRREIHGEHDPSPCGGNSTHQCKENDL
jgi:hypothetical protein